VVEMTANVDHFLTRCELACLMQELIGSYIMMEEYFMRQMVVKVSRTLQSCQRNQTSTVAPPVEYQ